MEKSPRAPRPDLARLRERAGLTQQQLADALGLKSARAVKAWERGTYAPSIGFALPLARALGASLQEVVEAVAGPDPGQGRAGRNLAGNHPVQDETERIPSEALASLAQHLDEAVRLVRIVQDDLAPSSTAGARRANRA